MGKEFDRSVVVGIVLLAALVLTNAAFSYWNTRRVHDDADLVAHSREVLEAAGSVRTNLRAMEATQRYYLLTGDGLPAFRQAEAATREQLARLAAVTRDNADQQARIAALQTVVAGANTQLNKTIQVREAEGLKAAAEQAAKGSSRHWLEEADRILTDFDRTEHELLATRQGETERAYTNSLVFGAASAGFGLLAVGLLVVLLRRSARARRAADEAQARLAAIVESSDDAIIGMSLDGGIRYWNAGAERVFGYPAAEAVDQPVTLIIPPERLAEERVIFDRLRRGERVDHFETVRVAKGGRRLDISLTVSPIRDRQGQVIGASKVSRDVTARTAAEAALRASDARNRFLLELDAATRPLTDPAEVMAVSARLLAEHLGADRCAYAEVEGEAVYVITGDHARGVPSVVGRWEVVGFGAEHLRGMRAGEPYVLGDAEADPRVTPDALPAYRATNIRAVVCVPLHKGGRWTAAMAVHQAAPRRWTPDEVDLVTTVAGRCWEALERGRVERTLRASEERFRTLFEAMDEGYCVVEPVFDNTGRATDYRYLLANPALEHHTGLRDVVGKTARQLMPGHESHWIEAYGQVAATGASVRRTERVTDLKRWYDVSAFPVGGGLVGVLFSDVTARMEAGEQLRASEQRLAEVFRHAPSFIGVLRGPDHVFELANDRYRHLVGGRELVGKPVREALPEVVGQGFVNLLDRVFRTGEPYAATDAQVRLGVGGEADERHIDFVYQPLRDADGAVTGIIVQGIDQTERVRAQVALRDRDERLQLFLGAASDYAVVISDPDDRVTEWLGGAERITGWRRDEVLNLPAGFFFTPEDRAAGVPEQEARRAAATGRAENTRWHQRKDGSQFFAEGVTVGIRGPGGELRGFGKVFRDRTDRKRAEDGVRFLADASASLAELVDYESTLRRIANLAVGGFADWCVVDLLEGGVRRRLAVTRAEPAEVSAARAEDTPDDGVVPHVLRTGEPEVVADLATVDEAAPQGAERIARLRAMGVRSYLCVPLLSARGRVIGGMTFLSHSARRRFGPDELRVAQDLAGRVTAAIESAQLYRDLQEQDRRKGEFLATLAHELRNPLAPVRNGVALLRSGLQNPAAAERTLGMMDRQLRHMVHLVDDLMDVSRVSSGKVALRKERVELQGVVEAAVEANRGAVEEGGHQLAVTLPPEPLAFDADRTRLAQVLANLLNNAAKYTPPGGRIELTAARVGNEAVIRVADTGVGIPADMLPRVFDMFTQVGTSLERSQGGLGIGLTLVKRLVEMHGGRVSAESGGEGQGSVFTVRLPLAAGAAHDDRREATGGEAAGAATRVLVVDDNVDAAESLALLLSLKGHEVKAVHDGPEALRTLGTYRPHLILLDLGLPGMSGYEVARRVRGSRELRGVTLAALTGWGQEEDRRRTKEAGFDHHLVKPADLTEVERILSTVGGG